MMNITDKNSKKYYLPTCCMLILSNVFKKTGYSDEAVFMYYDDTDLYIRINDAGY